MQITEAKKTKLKNIFRNYCQQDVCVAFSGGVDSGLVLAMACEAAREAKTKVLAVTMDTVLHPAADLEAARAVLKQTEAQHEVLRLDELSVPEILYNPIDRCYLCKRELYRRMKEFAAEKGIRILLEGSNEDDLHVYRPGLRAVRELEVKSPLAEAGLTKAEVRKLAGEYGLLVSDRPSAPCLATRLPYGTRIDLELLSRIEQAENFLKEFGWRNIRLRVHGDIARLEIDKESFDSVIKQADVIIARLKELGFIYVTLDLEGFRSGSMDIGLVP